MFQIIHDRGSDIHRHRNLVQRRAFPPDGEDSRAPVKIIESHLSDFPATRAEPGQH